MMKTAMFRNGIGRAGLVALSLGAALLVSGNVGAQTPDDARAKQEKVIADLVAQIDALVKERAAQEPIRPPAVADAGQAERAELRAKLAQLMKERAGAEFAGYAQEVAKERAQAELQKHLAADKVNAESVAERERAVVELRRAEALVQQKGAQAREIEVQVQDVTNRLRAAGFVAQSPADPKKTPGGEAKTLQNKIVVATEGPDADRIRAELKMLEAELQKKTAEAQQIRAQMEVVRARMKQDEGAKPQSKQDDKTLRLWLSNPDQKGGEPQEIILRKVDGAWKVVDGKEKKEKTLRVETDGSGGIKVFEGPEVINRFTPPVPPAPPGAPAAPGSGAIRSTPPAVPQPPQGQGSKVPMGSTATMRPPGGEPDNRIDNLERKLEKMMQVLEQMRKDMERKPEAGR